MVFEFLKGYPDLVREIFFLKNNKNFFKLKLSIFSIILILGGIGFLRNALHVFLGITQTPEWHSFNPDIVFTMFVFPIYLCFFSAFILHFLSEWIGEKIPYNKLFSFAFYLQFLHLIVPFLDYIGFQLQLPWFFPLALPAIQGYFFPVLVFTLGITVIWLVTGYLTSKVFIKYFKIKKIETALILTTCFIFLYLPIYHLWPAFNTVFNFFFIPGPVSPKFFYGYGAFFVICSFIGIWYYKKKIAK